MVERNSTAFEKLTPREREILRLIAAHLQSKEIARALGLSPKTVEMHVLSARRRLSGMSRRDAALAFVAWEAEDPGNDYRRQPDGMVALAEAPLSDREIGNDHAQATVSKPDVPAGLLHGQLGLAGGLPDLAGGDSGAGRPGAGGGVGPAQVAGDWRTAFKDLVAGPGAGGDGLPHGRPAAQRNWRHELSNLQWLGVILAVTAATSVLLAVTAIGLHAFIKAVERIMAGH
jgi:DNA-binding CsgD family transcriptional regulator